VVQINTNAMPCFYQSMAIDMDRIQTPETEQNARRDKICVHHPPGQPSNTRFGEIISGPLAIAAKPNKQKGKEAINALRSYV